MEKGWLTQGNARYYLGTDGAMAVGYREVDGKTRYFTESGALASGWQSIGGSMYCFDEEGCAVTGWKQMDGKWYCFEDDGRMKTGIVTLGGVMYYLMPDGTMAANTVVEDNGQMYQADASGALTPYVPVETSAAETEGDVPQVPAAGQVQQAQPGEGAAAGSSVAVVPQ